MHEEKLALFDELEELKKEISDRQETEESLVKELIKLGNQLEELKRYPTSEEVCKALSEYLSRGVKKDKDNNFYYSEQKQYYGECDEIICGYGWENEHHTIAFEFDLPPYLITLIGRFYEGVGK